MKDNVIFIPNNNSAVLDTDKEILNLLLDPTDASKNKGFLKLYRSCFPVIRDYIVKRGGQYSDADDIFQEALLVTYQKVCNEKLTLNCSLQTYLFSIAKNQWRKNKRDHKEKLILDDDKYDLVEIDPTDIEQILFDDEKSNTIAGLLDQLGGSCRNVLIFYYYEKMNMKEIADTLNLKNAQVAKNKKSICLTRLKDLVLNSSLYKNMLK
ncbi:MAG: sigma-70 family RNA polymerase sigma factor [Bacteroidota bacterium]